MLHYTLYRNELTTGNPNNQFARPVDVVNNKREDLVEDITGPGSILKPVEVNGSIDSYWQTITEYTRKGKTYSDDYISTHFNISGVFTDKDDYFDPSRHTLTVNIQLKPTVSRAVEEVELKKVDGRKSRPEINSVYDWGSNSTNRKLTVGDVLEIRGEMLKISHNLEGEEGVFFVNQDSGIEIRQGEIHINEPKRLILRIPELTAGNYRLEVRNTRYDGKTLRIGSFTQVLTVS